MEKNERSTATHREHPFPPGYVVPVFRSLYEPVLLMGAPRRPAVFLWCCTFLCMLSVGSVWLLLPAAIIHIVMAVCVKQDEHFFAVFVRWLRTPRRLDP